MNNKNIQHVINALARINRRLSVGEQFISAEELRLLRRARRDWKKKLMEFTNPKAPARPLPVRPQNFAAQRSLFNR